MNDFERLIKILDVDLTKVFIQTVDENDDYLTLLIDSQLDKGKDGSNKNIRPLYTQGYKNYKSKRGGVVDRVNLKLTNEYRSSRRYKYGEYYVESFHENNEDLAQILVNRYGADIEQLSPQNEELFIKRIFDQFMRNAFGDL